MKLQTAVSLNVDWIPSSRLSDQPRFHNRREIAKMAMSKEQLGKWLEAASDFEAKDYPQALNTFLDISETSKIHYNVAMTYMNLNKPKEARLALNRASTCDSYFALAYFQRAWILTTKGDFLNACKDFREAYIAMREIPTIDYTQLGLKYVLKTHDILFNFALCFIHVGDLPGASKNFNRAIRYSTDSREKQEAEEAIAYGMDATKFFTIRHAPISLIYKPSADTIQTLEHKDFLGQRQVIAVNSNQTPPPSNMTRSRTVDSGLTRNRSSPNPTSITAPPIRTVLNKFNSPQSVIPQRGSSAHSIASQAQRSRSHSAGSASRPAHLDSAGSDPALNTPLSAVTPRRPSNGPSRTGPSPSSRPNYDPFASPDSTDPFSPNYPSSVLSSPSNYARRGSSLGRVTPNAEGPPTPRKGSLLSQPVSELDVADSIHIRLHYESDMRIIYVPVGSDYDSLINRITEKLKLPGPPDVKYKDEDGTLILITDDEDLALGIRSGNVWELDGTSREQPEWDLWVSL